MIKVTISRNANKQIDGFTMSGHAEFSEHGKDLVCAGASAVSFGTLNAIHSITGITPVIKQGGDGGYLRCEIPENVDLSALEQIHLLLEGMVVSLKTIELDYSKYIKINDN
ncbi:ribosomal-processing cysteine protease Prp [Priestia flexa]|uniref:ribosomal-processing cysteine protease Prp n=1 Tax=Priestia flexa TaxID=86664 RepID=UPI00240D55DB|nr:ribosomal-processing cysteine protease Prp [Priestia flexa]WEZ09401.1 ribosomal-processing cysteine protease Prp [Priestia flexa]